MKVVRCCLVIMLIVIAVVCGCTQEKFDETMQEWGWKDKPAETKSKVAVPPDIDDTIAEVATLISGGDAPIGGYGVVIGLGKDGSSEVPPQIRPKLVKYLKHEIKIGSSQAGTDIVSIGDFLRDKDTAVVRVNAIIPPGAPEGTEIDMMVSALPRTQTTSLEGGVLLPTELVWESAASARGRYLKPLGKGGGAIFVNPFLDPDNPKDRAKYRQGRVLGGAKTTRDMAIRLQLHKPDYHTANLIQRRINERFPTRGPKIAKAKNRYSVEVRIPDQFKKNYNYFLQLLLHLPRQRGAAAFEAHAKRIARAMKKPGANYQGLAMVWEAMGRQILPTVQDMYSSTNPAAAFYATRAGLRLGDTDLAAPIILKIATTPKARFQLAAIDELGLHPEVIEAGDALRKLLNAPSELVRIAAYEALIKRGSLGSIKRIDVDGEFYLDLVQSSGDYVVYATRTGKPRLVLFGDNMEVSKPVFYKEPEELVTIFSKKADPLSSTPPLFKDHLVVFRKLENSGRISDKFRSDFKVKSLILNMGNPPRPDRESGKIQGLGLTYGQIVSVLCRMCKQKDIAAKFVLQPLPEIQKIYRTTPSIGRPDKPTH